MTSRPAAILDLITFPPTAGGILAVQRTWRSELRTIRSSQSVAVGIGFVLGKLT